MVRVFYPKKIAFSDNLLRFSVVRKVLYTFLHHEKILRPILVQNHSFRFLVSACLAGINCTYSGNNKLKAWIKRLLLRKEAIAVCPEVMAGLGIPRENAEITGGSGEDVLRRRARVLTISGKDVSRSYIIGANKILKIALAHGIKTAILKSKSPACGRGKVYDGSFRNVLKRGDGVAAALLSRNGIKVYTEEMSPDVKRGILRRDGRRRGA